MKKIPMKKIPIVKIIPLGFIFVLAAMLQAWSTAAQSATPGICSDNDLGQFFGNVQVATQSVDGDLFVGFDAARYLEEGPMPVALITETAGARFLYAEPCDICAELVACDKQTGLLYTVAQAHQLSCDDMPKQALNDVIFTICARQAE